MNAGVEIKSPDDLLPFLDHVIDGEKFFWLVTMTVPHAVIRGQTTSLRQASAVLSCMLQPAQIAGAIVNLTKWMVERPHLVKDRSDWFPVQRTLSQPLVSWFMDRRHLLLDKAFPEPATFKHLMKLLRRDGVRITVEAKTRMWMQ